MPASVSVSPSPSLSLSYEDREERGADLAVPVSRPGLLKRRGLSGIPFYAGTTDR